MTTLRIARRRQYVRLDSRAVNDDRLSFRARGILAWLLEKPDDWSADSDSIAERGKEGRDAVRSALRELETCGYLMRRKFQDDSGHWRTETHVGEYPDVFVTEDGIPVVGGPAVGLPVVGEPGAITNTSSNEEVATQDSTQVLDLPAPLDIVIEVTRRDPFDRFWNVYPRKAGKAPAEKAFAKASKKTDVEKIIAAAKAFAADPNRVDQFTAHAATWLNQERWNDPPLPPRAKPTAEARQASNLGVLGEFLNGSNPDDAHSIGSGR